MSSGGTLECEVLEGVCYSIIYVSMFHKKMSTLSVYTQEVDTESTTTNLLIHSNEKRLICVLEIFFSKPSYGLLLSVSLKYTYEMYFNQIY